MNTDKTESTEKPLPIIVWPAKILTTPTKPVVEFNASLESLLKDLRITVRKSGGIGIAANQIGVPLSVALVGRENGTFFEIVNPTILESDGFITWKEGCLSLSGAWEAVKRSRRIRVRYQDKEGKIHEEEVDEKLAHVFQHEIDHLNGVPFVMHLSSLKRGLIRDKMTKLQRRAHG